MLTKSLKYDHYAGKEYQGEVGLLSRNIKLVVSAFTVLLYVVGFAAAAVVVVVAAAAFVVVIVVVVAVVVALLLLLLLLRLFILADIICVINFFCRF